MTGCSRSDAGRAVAGSLPSEISVLLVIHMRVAWTSSERPRAENTSSGEPRCGVCSSSASAPGATRWWRTARLAAGESARCELCRTRRSSARRPAGACARARSISRGGSE